MRAFITGATGGLGRAMAVSCAQRGFDLFLTDRDAAALLRLKAGLKRRFAVDVRVAACDLTDTGDVKRLMRRVDRLHLRFGMLLNVAGVDFEGGFLERECDKLMTIVNVNVTATLHVTHEVLRRREAGKKFYLVFVSSLASLFPMPLKAIYAASKRFLLDFSLALGQELRAEKVNVLALCPGGLPTTEDTIRGIEAQGLWGHLTTNPLERVARKTIAGVLSGRRVYIPGKVNWLLGALGKLVPRRIVTGLIYLRWNSAQEKWLRLQH
jgi:short-subunit dehydrogenase